MNAQKEDAENSNSNARIATAWYQLRTLRKRMQENGKTLNDSRPHKTNHANTKSSSHAEGGIDLTAKKPFSHPTKDTHLNRLYVAGENGKKGRTLKRE